MTVKRTADAARACECMLLRAAENGEGLLWLLPDYGRVVECRKKLAEAASPLRLGCTVSTLDAWVEDAWALWGDGRLLVSAVQRKILMAAVLSDSPDEGSPLFSVSAGTLDLFCSTAKTAAAFDAGAFAAAPADAAPAAGAFAAEASALAGVRLTPAQEKMLVVLRTYRAALDERGLVEPALAMGLLASREELRWPFAVCEGFGVLSPEEALFFAALSERASVTFVEEAVAGSRFDAASALLGSLRRACEVLGLSCEIEEEASSAFGSEVDSELALAPERVRSATAPAHRLAHPELSALARALYDAQAVGSVEPQGRLRVLLPAGRYAESSLLMDAVESSDARTVLVACVDPARMFEDVSEALARRGFDSQASFARPFKETDFGRAFANALEMAAEPADVRPDTFLASDFLFTELSERGSRGVYALDERWRGRRSLDGAGVASDMAEAAERYAAPFAALVRAGSFERAFDLAEARYRALSSEDEAFRAEQLAAVACARRALEQLRLLGCADVAGGLRGYLETARVAVRVRSSAVGDCGGRLVCIMPYREAAACPAGSYDAVFACDMNAESQPVRLRRSSADALFEAFGFGFDRDVLFESRLTFLRVLASARDSLYLLRRLNDVDAAPLYPSIAFEEVMACYPGEPDKVTAVASSLLSAADGELVSHRGEELLMRNALLLPNDPSRRVIETAAFDVVSAGFREKLMDPVRLLSPSAIEDYLDCPHKWFARRRLRLASVDAGFSALEKGSFAHEVLKRFYLRYAVSCGSPKPRTREDLSLRAVPLLREVFAETLAEQAEKDPSDNPLIALSQSEKAQVEELLRYLEGFLARDAALLPAFEPRYFEYSFGRGEDVFEYAGMPLCGSIDRIDVDAQGRAVIVDYKSSLGDAHQLLPSDADGFEVLPAKVQTLIYAQVARRKLGLEMAGALYVHVLKPGSQPPVCGAYDDGLLGPDDIPGLRVSRSALSAAGCASFGELLDRVEDLVAGRLAGLRAGCIRVDPRTDTACAFCPVLSCEGRK